MSINYRSKPCNNVTKLTVSYVGFNSKTVDAAPELTIYLEENSQILDEVVVVGYQTIRKADLTGAVAVMDMKEPLSENSGNIMNSMAGKLPGVNVVPDAAPGGTGSIRVRGMSTANSSNDPLYIIDGVPTDNINCINPSDIETMQVLKDAASASIYGSRAANGVVIITTKQGKGDRMSININYAASAQIIAKRYHMLDANQWGVAYWAASANSNIKPSHILYGDGSTPVLQQYVAGNPNFAAATRRHIATEMTGSTISFISKLENPGAVYTLTYSFVAGGIRVTADYDPYVCFRSPMPRFGFRFGLPQGMDQIDWYGRGPVENYPDRKSNALIGEYHLPLADFITNYPMPQENANRCDIRWCTFADSTNGECIKVTFDQPGNFRAWPYLEQSVMEAKHPSELTDCGYVNVNIDQYIQGVGGINSWGAEPLDAYKIDSHLPRTMSFTITYSK